MITKEYSARKDIDSLLYLPKYPLKGEYNYDKARKTFEKNRLKRKKKGKSN